MSESQNNNMAVSRSEVVHAEVLPVGPSDAPDSIVPKILRRWRTVLVTFVLLAGLGVPAVWLFIQPKYQARAAIRVRPVVYSILYTDQQSDNVMPMYDNFKNTQVSIMLSENVLQDVADELTDKDLKLFEKRPEGLKAVLKRAWQDKDFKLLLRDDVSPLKALQRAAREGDLAVQSGRRDELLEVSMTSPDPQEAALIVDTLIRAYMVAQTAENEQGDDKKLRLLQDEQRSQANEVEQQQESILRMTEEYGMADLGKRHDMLIENMEDLNRQLTQIEANRAELEEQIGALEEGSDDSLLLQEKESEQTIEARRSAYVNGDERIKKLTESVIVAEEELILAQQTLAEGNPQLQLKQDMIDALG